MRKRPSASIEMRSASWELTAGLLEMRGLGTASALDLRLQMGGSPAEGFTAVELMGTLAGAPLYTAAGFVPVESVVEPAGGTPVPLVKMRKPVTPA
jgi:hypothetical protein